MASFFSKLFKIGQAEAHAIVDKFEDPIKMTEQGIRDLKEDLQKAMTSLAEVKAIAIRTRRDSDQHQKQAADYERKAMMLLQKARAGDLDAAEADRLATEALSKKEQSANESIRVASEAQRHEQMASQLQAGVNKLKSAISSYENELATLRARAKTASSTQKINRQLSKIDSSGTLAMLEKMKSKVEEDESLASAYADMASADKSVDEEIQTALATGRNQAVTADLAALKKKMGIV